MNLVVIYAFSISFLSFKILSVFLLLLLISVWYMHRTFPGVNTCLFPLHLRKLKFVPFYCKLITNLESAPFYLLEGNIIMYIAKYNLNKDWQYNWNVSRPQNDMSRKNVKPFSNRSIYEYQGIFITGHTMNSKVLLIYTLIPWLESFANTSICRYIKIISDFTLKCLCHRVKIPNIHIFLQGQYINPVVLRWYTRKKGILYIIHMHHNLTAAFFFKYNLSLSFNSLSMVYRTKIKDTRQ